MYYTVGEMAKRLGVAPSTLRYYDQEGLLPFVERSEGGIRLFKESDYEWLGVIGCLKKTGMQLRDIKTFIEMAMQGDQTIEPRLALITKQKESRICSNKQAPDGTPIRCFFVLQIGIYRIVCRGSCRGDH